MTREPIPVRPLRWAEQLVEVEMHPASEFAHDTVRAAAEDQGWGYRAHEPSRAVVLEVPVMCARWAAVPAATQAVDHVLRYCDAEVRAAVLRQAPFRRFAGYWTVGARAGSRVARWLQAARERAGYGAPQVYLRTRRETSAEEARHQASRLYLSQPVGSGVEVRSIRSSDASEGDSVRQRLLRWAVFVAILVVAGALFLWLMRDAQWPGMRRLAVTLVFLLSCIGVWHLRGTGLVRWPKIVLGAVVPVVVALATVWQQLSWAIYFSDGFGIPSDAVSLGPAPYLIIGEGAYVLAVAVVVVVGVAGWYHYVGGILGFSEPVLGLFGAVAVLVLGGTLALAVVSASFSDPWKAALIARQTVADGNDPSLYQGVRLRRVCTALVEGAAVANGPLPADRPVLIAPSVGDTLYFWDPRSTDADSPAPPAVEVSRGAVSTVLAEPGQTRC